MMLSAGLTTHILSFLLIQSFLVTGQTLIYQTTSGSGSGNENDGVSSLPFPDQSGFNITRKNQNLTILTSYIFDGCNADRKKILNQAVLDAVDLAAYGMDWIHGGTINEFPWIDLRTQAAIDYFGPESQSREFQDEIFGTIYNAMYAYPGWGFGDWWKNRYVTLSCQDAKQYCRLAAVYAYNYDKGDPRTPNKGQYPATSFCSLYFSDLPSFSDAVGGIKANKNREKENVLNIRSKGSLMLHEWLHMSWGVAKVYAGDGHCVDDPVAFGPPNHSPDVELAYGPGIGKNIARRDSARASYTNDNYVYFCAARYMEKVFGKYPQYPVAWVTYRSAGDNKAAERLQPGNPSWNPASLVVDRDLANGNESVSTVTASDLPPSDYPVWYQPILKATVNNNASRTFTLPSITTPDPASDPKPTAGTNPATLDPKPPSSSEKAVPAPTTTPKKTLPLPSPSPALLCPQDAGFGTDYGECLKECKGQGGECTSTPIFAHGSVTVLWACSCK